MKMLECFEMGRITGGSFTGADRISGRFDVFMMRLWSVADVFDVSLMSLMSI
jgi:hypothetical protein